ncbi:MAG: BREX-2 system adenine-specific DNA-methyltransferase PglX [Proteobacteria bacterium]|nr:BREX-2 system adenine-specific DNA-methyltransferase PglX [Pseudomonadota bacterium]
MKPADRARLTTALRDHVAKVAEDLRAKIRAEGPARDRAKKLHADEQVGEDFDVWTDLLARRAAVLWVLKSVYVRVVEDRKLLSPGRILDIEAQQLFERLAPNLGETAFLRWVYRDLASPKGGLPELFSPQPAEVVSPSDELSRELLLFWRHRDPDTGTQWSFADERFEGELMGDLYQDLDPVVKDRFALCQTPDFVREFILDRTLTPAIETFGADAVRLLDPACGSGHFLIDGLKRLVAATAEKQPEWNKRKLVTHCLERVVGIDLNDYACALARARLVMTAAELAGIGTLAEAAQFHPHVYWADGLEQVEKGKDTRGQQLDLLDPTKNEAPRASLTKPEVRAALRELLQPGFHAVVANPPYIVEKDDAQKAYHRERVGGRRRYVSAHRQYSLASPFTERCFQLAMRDAFVGLITSNNFMKREFGKPLVEKVLAALDLTLVVDTSQAYIPFHGTPTVLLFGCNGPPSRETVRAVMGKRGESGTPDDPATGQVWSSLVEGWDHVGFENEYVSVAELPRETLNGHPWSLGGGGAAELKEKLDAAANRRLKNIAHEIGRTTVCGQDPIYMMAPDAAARLAAPELVKPLTIGEVVRDWSIQPSEHVLYPYVEMGGAPIPADHPAVRKYFWSFRTLLRSRTVFGKSPEQRGGTWYEHLEHYAERLRTPLSIAFAFVATHNHFVLERGGKVFKQSAPVIKLPPDATEDDHLALLGLLNSSVACFWMKQVFHNKGIRGQGGGLTVTDWEQFYEFDATKSKLFPIAKDVKRASKYAKQLDLLARERLERHAGVILDDVESWLTARELRCALDRRREQDFLDFQRMAALQEELDWLCYALYGLDDQSDVVSPDEVEPLLPTYLPWCLDFAQRDAANRAALANGKDADELPTVWFERHRWDPVIALPRSVSSGTRARIEARRERTRRNPELALIETANFKRRWYRPDYESQEKQALTTWLAEHVEAAAQERGRTATIQQLVAALQGDTHVLAACEVLTGRRDFNLSHLVAQTMFGEAVPNHRFHIYKPSGLAKRSVWERTWADQRCEDAGEKVIPEVPPSYRTGDFIKPEYWKLRGKLDVPKERFIAFTEVPGRNNVDTLYGWAGWTSLERLKAILAIDEELEDGGVPLADRIALLDSAWRLLPDVAREDATAASRLKAELQALVGSDGPSRELLEEWRKRFPPPSSRASRKNSKATKKSAGRRKRSSKKKSEANGAEVQEES